MTYQPINPPFYETLQPQTPFHVGARGWSRAPFPGWGQNPVLRGPDRFGIRGLGAYYPTQYNWGIHGLGAYYPTQYNWGIHGLGAHDLPMESLQPHYAPLPGATGALGCGCSGAKGVGAVSSDRVALYVGLGVTATLLTLGYFALRPQHARNRRRRYRRNGRWSRAFKNRLPDSAFLYVDKSCVTEKYEGASHPLSCRKFPYKKLDGRLDLPHLRNAIARIPRSNVPERLKPKLQAKARKILARAHA